MRRSTAVIAVLALSAALLAACTGAPRPQALKTGKGRAGQGFGPSGAALGAGDSTTSTTGAAATAAGSSSPGTAGAARRSGSSAPGGGGGGLGGPGQAPSPAPQPGDANLYSGAANVRGITANSIKLCGHAALIFAKAFNTDKSELSVYWEWVNAHGGIYGRQVSIDWNDDQYTPQGASQAMTTCESESPFLILGGIGFDQIPTVRNMAEQDHELYIHHIATAAGAEHDQYSFTMQPSLEDTGRAFGEYMAAHHHGQSIGIIWRDSENWTPGSDTARDYLKAHGERIVADDKVEANQSEYGNAIVDMQTADGGKGAKVVFIWENALAAQEIIQQAHNQGYNPTFVVFPFQTTLDLLNQAGDGLQSPIEGVGTWPAYQPGGYGNVWPEHEYLSEIQKFEAAQQTYDGKPPNDILWQTWLGMKQLHDLFLRCGQDCTRNHFAGLMLNGYKTTVEPNCIVDFTRGNAHRGGWDFTTMAAYDAGGGQAQYKTTQWCSEHLI
jgi:ABC-type branched-subunit amino acid transport system substrate-binding protein